MGYGEEEQHVQSVVVAFSLPAEAQMLLDIPDGGSALEKHLSFFIYFKKKSEHNKVFP